MRKTIYEKGVEGEPYMRKPTKTIEPPPQPLQECCRWGFFL